MNLKIAVKRLCGFVLLPLAIVYAVIWSSDSITLQGERTVYAAGCEQGAWDVDRCTGKMVAGDRYRFRALRAHGEVIFWTVGVAEPSGKFTGCDVTDGRNWSCRARSDTPDAARTVTLEMVHGRAVRDRSGPARPFHPVSKLTWVLLKRGWWFGNAAEKD